MQFLLGLILLWVSQLGLVAVAAVDTDSDPRLVLRFCVPGISVADIDVTRDCTLTNRPELEDEYGTTEQLILATIEGIQAGQQTAAFWVTPYYLRKITFFGQTANGWQPILGGGAVLGPELDLARLGGHRFEVPVVSNNVSRTEPDKHAY